jgi:hypothetical protein
MKHGFITKAYLNFNTPSSTGNDGIIQYDCIESA